MKNKEGLTLVEVIITLAIIGIIIVPLLTIFTTGFKNIKNAGDTTINTFKLQDEINNKIIQNEGVDTTIEVTIPGIVNNEKIEGKLIFDEQDMITTFIPND